MQKFINRAENITREMLEGLVLAHSDELALAGDRLVVNKKLAQAKRVAVVAMGAVGCEPGLCGLVGEGLLDVFVAGDVFAAPGPQACLDALQLADRGEGVLLILGNHTGAVLAADIAVRQAQKLGLEVQQVLVQDNIADAGREQRTERQGLLGCVPLCKVAAAAAAEGKTLAEVAALAERVAQNMATIAVTTQTGTHPATGELLAEQGAEQTMRVGTGELGEGGEVAPLMTADGLAELLVPKLAADLALLPGEKLLFLVSGSGATTLMEQLIVFRSCYKLWAEQGVEIAARQVGNLLTAQDTYGLTLCAVRMDEELLRFWQAPCAVPYFKN